MNAAHLELCSGPEWARLVEEDLLPWALAGRDLGDDVLEVGPGPGLTTDVLRRTAPRLTAVEIERELADTLAARLAGTNVTVIHGDAADLPFPDERFSAAACFTMLHHVTSVQLQDRLLTEMHRVLRVGGVLVGVDGVDTPERRRLHVGDVFLPVEPHSLPSRLEAAGFAAWTVETNGDRVRFAATRQA